MIDKITTDKELDGKVIKSISIISLLITIALFWIPIYRVGRVVLFDLSKIPLINELPFATVPLELKPGLRAGVIGLILITPLYLRGILYWKKTSIYSLVCFCLNLCLSATIVTICLENVKESILDAIWLIHDIRMVMLAIALVLTWIGLRAFAGIAYILLFLLVMVNLSYVNEGMAFNGFLCILFGAIGLITQSGLKPHELLKSIVDTFRGPGVRVKESMVATKRFKRR